MNAPDEEAEAQRYSMVIEWSDADQAYIVTVPELPGCMTHGATHAEAVQQGEAAIATWLATARAYGDPIPRPRVFATSAH
jgi:predicted RNase H-like HicB family nuclease